MKRVMIFSIFLVFMISFTSAGIYLGITDGYVKHINGSFVSGADVSLTVNSCSGAGCTGTAVSESAGYYIIGNLNLPAAGSVSLTVNKSVGSGSAIGTADAYQIVHKNITICYPPSSPTFLTDIPNDHNTTFTFNWIPGTDSYYSPSLSLYNQFNFDGSVINQSSGYQRANVSFAAHSWGARTCNNYCCSSFATDSFTNYNNAPSAPSNINATEISNSIVQLNWTSGIDPESDSVYDELDWNGTIYSSINPPYNVNFSLLVNWKIRTCDSYGYCSSWVESDSIFCDATLTCPACSCSCGGGGGGGGSESCVSQKTKIYCNGILYGEDSLKDLKINSNKNTISIYGTNETLENLEYCPWCYNGNKDYDESGVDCGGSCRDCAEREKPKIIEAVQEAAKQVGETIQAMPPSTKLSLVAALALVLAIVFYFFIKHLRIKMRKKL